jgi:hypothetical protein
MAIVDKTILKFELLSEDVQIFIRCESVIFINCDSGDEIEMTIAEARELAKALEENATKAEKFGIIS